MTKKQFKQLLASINQLNDDELLELETHIKKERDCRWHNSDAYRAQMEEEQREDAAYAQHLSSVQESNELSARLSYWSEREKRL